MDYKKYILENFEYRDGNLFRKDRKNGNGSIDKDGYLIVKVKGKQFKAHRIVWLLCNGDFPDGEIDHINRNKLDNRIENLRESSRMLQILNRDLKKNSDTDTVGIYYDKTTKGLKKRYTFHFRGKSYRYSTLEEAQKKKEELRNEYYKEELDELKREAIVYST